jgi:hypothetical protein
VNGVLKMATANMVLGVKMPRRIELLVKERVTIIEEPYMFKIIGSSGVKTSHSESAHSLFDHLKRWAEEGGSEVRIIKDRYSEIHQSLPVKQRTNFSTFSKGQSKGYLKVEITDPSARILESILAK